MVVASWTLLLNDSQHKHRAGPELSCEKLLPSPKWQSRSLFKLWNGFIMSDNEIVFFRPNKANRQCYSLIVANKNYFDTNCYKWSQNMFNYHCKCTGLSGWLFFSWSFLAKCSTKPMRWPVMKYTHKMPKGQQQQQNRNSEDCRRASQSNGKQ